MKYQIAIIILSVLTSNLFSQNKYERYHVQTGRVVYKTEKNKETIIKTIIFKDWGAEELIVTETTTYTNKKKNKIEKKETIVTKLYKALIYTVDEDEKKIYQTKNYYFEWQKDKNMADHGKVIAEDWGGEKIREEVFLGYNCQVWKLKGLVTYNYKGIMMKSEAKYAPEVAIEAKFDIPVSQIRFFNIIKLLK